MSEAQLEALLLEARRLNLETDVTGVLLYGDGNFMQCFEGTPEAMDVTYDRIKASRTHTGIIEMIDEEVDARSFQDWRMGFTRITKSEMLSIASAQWEHHVGDASPADSYGMALLKQFWRQERSDE